MSKETKEQVRELVSPVVIASGCELADISLSRYKNKWTLKLFVYCDGGVSIDTCAKVSTAVGDAIDATELFSGGYTLEVSSPGLDRDLTTLMDFRYRVGEKVKLTFRDKDKKAVEATILATGQDEVEFKSDSGTFVVPVAEIEKAVIQF